MTQSDSPFSFWQQFRLFPAALHFYVRACLKISRRDYVEKPVRFLPGLTAQQQNVIETLNAHYHAYFEQRLNYLNSLENYHLLHLLHVHRAYLPSTAACMVDVGSRNFVYLPVFMHLFSPKEIHGVEIDAYPLMTDGHTRFSQATYYLSFYASSFYHVCDFLRFRHTRPGSCDVISMFYPFVSPRPFLSWSLPKSAYHPENFFKHAHQLLVPGGALMMINQGYKEFLRASYYAQWAGFKNTYYALCRSLLLPRPDVPILSVWNR